MNKEIPAFFSPKTGEKKPERQVRLGFVQALIESAKPFFYPLNPPHFPTPSKNYFSLNLFAAGINLAKQSLKSFMFPANRLRINEMLLFQGMK